MCDSLPKEFEKTSEVLPFTKYGLSSLEEFKKAEKDVHRLEWLKKAGLTGDEIKLYLDNEAGNIDEGKKIESDVLATKLKAVYNKVAKIPLEKSVTSEDVEALQENNVEQVQQKPSPYPDGHPMNRIKDLEENLFGHLKNEIPPINKRRKILRRLERRKKRAQAGPKLIAESYHTTAARPGSLWDLKEPPPPRAPIEITAPREEYIGPKKRTMYTIKNNRIVKVSDNEHSQNDEDQELGNNNPDDRISGDRDSLNNEDRITDDIHPDDELSQSDEGQEDIHPDLRLSDDEHSHDEDEESDIILPEGEPEGSLLEGTKMSLDDIMKIEEYKDYEPGIPSKVVHLSNIESAVTQEQLSLLFQQYVCDNGGPPDIQLLTGNLRGQAKVHFQNYDIAISAVNEINGTIVNGQPIIAKFAPSTAE